MKKQETDNVERILKGITVEDSVELLQAIRVSKELKTSIVTIGGISRAEMLMLVNLFYQQQAYRKAIKEQIRSIEQGRANGTKTTVMVLNYVLNNVALIENEIQKILKLVVESDVVGNWLLQIIGIGPVLAAGCLAYFNIEGKEYATQFMSYAGLNDNKREWLGRGKSKEIINAIVGKEKRITDDMVYEIAAKTKWNYNRLLDKAYDEKKGVWSKEKLISACAIPPYNTEVKAFMYKVGSAFQWVCNKPDSVYGRIYNQRKVLETQRNEEGWNKEYCKKALRENSIAKSTETYACYSEGKITKAQINLRAMRVAEQLFLSHLFEEMYRVHYDKVPPRYYTLVHMKELHNKEIKPEIPFTLVGEEKSKHN